MQLLAQGPSWTSPGGAARDFLDNRRGQSLRLDLKKPGINARAGPIPIPRVQVQRARLARYYLNLPYGGPGPARAAGGRGKAGKPLIRAP